MQYSELSIQQQEFAQKEAENLRTLYRSEYRFPFPTEGFKNATPNELFGMYGEPFEDITASLKSNDDEKYVELVASANSKRVATIPLQTILARRDVELVNEANYVLPAAGEVPMPSIAIVSCGYETDIRRLLFTASKQGLVKVFPPRISCGSEYVIAESIQSDYRFYNTSLPSIGFRVTESGHDMIEVLYIGPGCTDLEWLDKVVYNVINSGDYEGLEYVAGRSLDDVYDNN